MYRKYCKQNKQNTLFSFLTLSGLHFWLANVSHFEFLTQLQFVKKRLPPPSQFSVYAQACQTGKQNYPIASDRVLTVIIFKMCKCHSSHNTTRKKAVACPALIILFKYSVVVSKIQLNTLTMFKICQCHSSLHTLSVFTTQKNGFCVPSSDFFYLNILSLSPKYS